MKNEFAIRVRDLSKSYTIVHGALTRPSFREVIANRIRHPFHKTEVETFWALKDVTFDVKKGDVIGIIGRNGAGKSTLLKIMSRIVDPTNGSIDLFGRVGSLLEVGTGFHAELTGRENIYLNGAILGMRRDEIRRQFDAIVQFSEVEKFLDTPVKRYSSGMYVRLAFAVAAHLNPEILIVDEVLAVGDAAFQKRCLGKMKEVSTEGGRTVLFVSHNMAAIRALCNRAVLMNGGRVEAIGPTDQITDLYLSGGANQSSGASRDWTEDQAPRGKDCKIRRVWSESGGIQPIAFDCRKGFSINIEFELTANIRNLRAGFALKTMEGALICGSNDPFAWPADSRGPGTFISSCTFPAYCLNAGSYSVDVALDIPGITTLVYVEAAITLHFEDVEGHGPYHEQLPGIIRPKLQWRADQLESNSHTSSKLRLSCSKD